ncbi:MAG: GNAT family N-acetyltransferase [Paludibacteraceae bacterium]|nr:GNAT family N-acetyltransferase [Paludibacteraceae bacterium]
MSFFQSDIAYAFYSSLKCVKAFKVTTDKGYVQGYIQQEKGLLKGFFSRRAIVLGGPVLYPDATEEDVTKLLQKLKQATKSAIYTEIRAEKDYSEYKEAFTDIGFGYTPHLNVLIKCDTEEKTFDRMDENRRRQIRRAAESGVSCRYATNLDEVRTFYGLLKNHYKKKVKKPLFTWEFFEKMFTSGTGKYLLAIKDEKIIGGMLQVSTDSTVYDYYACGLDAEYQAESPSAIIYWETIKRAISDGRKIFDTMGAGTPEIPYGVRDFKLRFGGELTEFGRYTSINKPVLYKLGCLAIKIIS